jgi:hypothetical protein
LDSAIRGDFSDLINSLRFIDSAPISQPAPQINVSSPTPQQSVATPILLAGEAQGNWFFEATAPVVVVNWDGLIIGEGYIEAEGDWMTTDFLPFSGTVAFDLPVDSYSASGTIIFQRANPSDLPENDAAVEIPVVFE